MDKDEAVNAFVKYNLSILTSLDTTHTIVKKMRLDFCKKMNLKSGEYFKNKDVAEVVIKNVTKAKKNDPDLITDEIIKIPFIKKEFSKVKIKEIVLQHSTGGTSILTSDDLSQMQHEEYLKRIEKQFELEAKEKIEEEMSEQKKKLDELIEQVEKDKIYLKKYKSELKQLPVEIKFEENDLKIEKEINIEESLWWKQIGLIGNPFPSDEGLIGIPKELYDQIVVRTRFVNSYLTKVENSPEEFLGQSIVITGEFGSGKTTLLNMIRYKLGAKGILPCKIILIPSPDADAMVNELLRQLGKQLGKIILGMSGVDKKIEYGYVDSLSKLSDFLEDFKKYGGTGLIISVDGLHKGTKYFPQTLEFLQQLQNIHEFIEQEEVKCGFLLAGSLFWEKEIEGAPSLSGSISKIDVMPPMTEEDAVEAVIRRIHSFSPSGKSAPTIKRESIRIAFRTLQQRTEKTITFRSFMNHIRDRLKIGRYDEVGIGVSSHFETIDTIKKFVKSSNIGASFEAIEKEVEKYPDLRKILREVLVKIYQWSGVEESNRLFKTYMKVFNLLRVHGLIVQRKSPHGGLFVWSISPEFAKVLAEIQIKYSIPAEDTLSCIFESRKKVISKEKETIYSNIIERMTQSTTSLRDSWPKITRLLEESKEILNKAEKQIDSENVRNLDPSLLASSCKLLVTCVLEAGGCKTDDDTGDHDIFQNLWCAPDNVDEILEFCEKTHRFSTDSEVFGLLHHHSEIMEQLIDLLQQLTQGEGITRLSNRRLINEDMRLIHEARTLFINQNYRDTVDIACDLLEEKARDIGFTALSAIWKDKIGEIIPSDIFENLPKLETRGHPRTRRAPDSNLFYDISRSEYSKILFQKKIRKAIFNGDLRDFDFEKMKDIWEIAFSLGDREAHRDRPSYFREHATEIADVLRVIPIICERFLVIAERLLKNMKFEYEKSSNSIIGRFNVEGLTNVTSSKIMIETKDAQRIMRIVLSSIDRNPRDAIPLSRILIVEGLSIDKQIALVNAMINRGLININKPLSLEITKEGRDCLQELTNNRPTCIDVS